MPSLRLVAAECVRVVMLTAGLSLIGGIIVSDTFTYDHRNFLTRLALERDFWESGKILSHIKKNGRRIDGPLCSLVSHLNFIGSQLMTAFDRKTFHNLHRRRKLRSQFAFR